MLSLARGFAARIHRAARKSTKAQTIEWTLGPKDLLSMPVYKMNFLR